MGEPQQVDAQDDRTKILPIQWY